MTEGTGLRARVRAQLMGEFKAEARRQLADQGAPGLSLRAVTRALGMAPSAIYRYFPNRDELLTALIVDAYDSLGVLAEAADGRCEPSDFGGRWVAVGRRVRDWAVARPHEYALVYGSPVPGYSAPPATVGPASRITLVLAAIVGDAHRAGALEIPPAEGELTAETRADAERIAAAAMPGVPAHVVVRALEAWTQLFGYVSFELFGHFAGVVEDPAALFERSLLDMGTYVGLPRPAT